jgi:hypothetical protein
MFDRHHDFTHFGRSLGLLTAVAVLALDRRNLLSCTGNDCWSPAVERTIKAGLMP